MNTDTPMTGAQAVVVASAQAATSPVGVVPTPAAVDRTPLTPVGVATVVVAKLSQGDKPVRFEDALEVEPLDDGSNWLILQNFYYDSDVQCTGLPKGCAKGSRVTVEAGFTTDFASIPRVLWSLVGAPADGKYRKAAVVHDKLYRTPGLATRPQADSVFLEAMEACGVGWFARHTIYAGVRVGGSTSYKGGL